MAKNYQSSLTPQERLRVKTDALDYAIRNIYRQLELNQARSAVEPRRVTADEVIEDARKYEAFILDTKESFESFIPKEPMQFAENVLDPEKPLANFDQLPITVCNCLYAAEIRTLGDLIKAGPRTVRKTRGIGNHKYITICDFLNGLGISWN